MSQKTRVRSALVAAATLAFGSPVFAVAPGGCTCGQDPFGPTCEEEVEVHLAKGVVIKDQNGGVWICDTETHECTFTGIYG